MKGIRQAILIGQRATKRPGEKLTGRQNIGSDDAEKVQSCLTCEKAKCTNCLGGSYKKKAREKQAKNKGGNI